MAAPVPWEGAPRPPRKWQAEAMPIILDALRSDRRGIVAVATGGGGACGINSRFCCRFLLLFITHSQPCQHFLEQPT